MTMPGFWVETLENPTRYSRAQIESAANIAHQLGRGKFTLCQPPSGIPLSDEPDEWNTGPCPKCAGLLHDDRCSDCGYVNP